MQRRYCPPSSLNNLINVSGKVLLYAGRPAPSPLIGGVTLYDISWFLMRFHDFWWDFMIFDDLSWFLMIFHDCWWFIMIFHDFWWYSMNFDDLSWFLMIFHDFWWFFMIFIDFHDFTQISMTFHDLKFSSTLRSHNLSSPHLYEWPLKYVKAICHKIQ